MFGSWLVGILAKLLSVGAFFMMIGGFVVVVQDHNWGLVIASLVVFCLASFLRYLSGHTVRVK